MSPIMLHILGCGSAKPTTNHLPSAQILEMRGKFYMIDCGEGVQTTMQKMGLGMLKVGHIFISHNHGDHVFGLPGLISTMALLGRTAQLHIHGPEEMREFLNMVLKMYCEGIDYEVIFHPVRTHEHYLIFEDRSIEVWSIPLNHRVPCSGFLFKEKQSQPHIRREMIDAFNIPVSQINNIKAGASWTTEDGTVIPHERLTTPADPARSYAYCSDTRYAPEIAKWIEGVDLLYHEATFPHELLTQAKKTMHTTAKEAALVALKANAKKLIIGHYSARIKDTSLLLQEAKEVFSNTILANERLKVSIL
ncbi:MAG: ribonuclease Z [Bacteroidaceae bacterium]|jgi:ribonuclease Z|nr:ribonuclease Z [Bacteroidaceae bacterium]